MLYGHVNVNELERLNKYMGPFYFYMFLIIMSLILMNTFIGIIAASILEIRRKTAENDRGYVCQLYIVAAPLIPQTPCISYVADWCIADWIPLVPLPSSSS